MREKLNNEGNTAGSLALPAKPDWKKKSLGSGRGTDKNTKVLKKSGFNRSKAPGLDDLPSPQATPDATDPAKEGGGFLTQEYKRNI